MTITPAIIRTPTLAALGVIAVCAVFCTVGAYQYWTPKVDAVAAHIAKSYDDFMPEVTISNGKASIKKQQPYFVEQLEDEHVTVVIDTRENKLPEALGYLKNAETGVALTRETIVIKTSEGMRMIPLKGFPDMVLNSGLLLDIVDQYLPMVFRVAAVVAAIYFLIAKLVHALILALVPFLWARYSSASLTYRQAFKIASFAMIPPVMLDLFQYFSGTKVPAAFFVYFGLYLVLLVVAAREVVLDARTRLDA
jgi:hypothetical protein